MNDATIDRAEGALLGLAVGDALGMPTQYLAPDVVRARYGLLDGFYPGPEDNDISRGVPAGHVTDDTDQAIILGNLLVEGGGALDPTAFAKALLVWEEEMRATGSLDLLGPSTVKALALVSQGVSPDLTGRWGDTNGASMRIAPVGIAHLSEPLENLVDAVEDACRVTHNTGIAIAGAAAVAAAISSGLDGRPLHESIEIAIAAAEIGSRRGYYIAGPDVAARIDWALGVVRDLEPEEALDRVIKLIGVGVATQEAVPAALAIASLFPTDLWAVTRHAASLGGDCDTIAAIAGAIVGAHVGASSIPLPVREQLAVANPDLRLRGLALSLLELRANPAKR
ncbi:ADP-ribosylglycohydrolase family protein [Williamsia sp. 1135]|uniref:ADP-ribosylglycohydrolase family protein n=1 Tax=Williamsia sp. 1135 TaxID=1889262 RepID=UPI000A0F450B|nr:ADP-ribosylglycohydrolase family protein [Williamsia sp. 1135]ORM36201.1 ADP-ribosylglycohydrolase [Williamsia sp. 1135]